MLQSLWFLLPVFQAGHRYKVKLAFALSHRNLMLSIEHQISQGLESFLSEQALLFLQYSELSY
jgi:hypothetical protein